MKFLFTSSLVLPQQEFFLQPASCWLISLCLGDYHYNADICQELAGYKGWVPHHVSSSARDGYEQGGESRDRWQHQWALPRRAANGVGKLHAPWLTWFLLPQGITSRMGMIVPVLDTSGKAAAEHMSTSVTSDLLERLSAYIPKYSISIPMLKRSQKKRVYHLFLWRKTNVTSEVWNHNFIKFIKNRCKSFLSLIPSIFVRLLALC